MKEGFKMDEKNHIKSRSEILADRIKELEEKVEKILKTMDAIVNGKS